MKNNIKRDAEKVYLALTQMGTPLLGWDLRGRSFKPGLVYTAGNGGSASIADHMACDFMKSTFKPGIKGPRVVSLASNTAILTAIANDHGVDETFSRQIMLLRPAANDVVILISSSGTSKNIARAAEESKRLGCTLIGFTGNAGNSNGGKLREWANCSVHCSSSDYGVIEDYHSNVMHEVVRYIKNTTK